MSQKGLTIRRISLETILGRLESIDRCMDEEEYYWAHEKLRRLIRAVENGIHASYDDGEE